MHVIGLNGVMEPVNGMLFPSEVVIRLNRLLTLEFTSRGDLSAMFISNLGGSGNSEFVLGENAFRGGVAGASFTKVGSAMEASRSGFSASSHPLELNSWM